MKIALIGYGKMGKEIEQTALSRGHEIVSIIDVDNRQDMKSEIFRSADAAIEFTAPQAAYKNCVEALSLGLKVVSGSTGWMGREEREKITALCEKEGKTFFWSSNYSLGVAIFSALNRYLAGIMNDYPQYEVSMTETHHIHKLDAPSGTAVTLAQEAVERLARKTEWVKGTLTAPDGTVSGKNCFTENRLPVHSIRKGEVPGIHTIRYESDADSIVLTHDAKNRKGLALGAVLAAEFIQTNRGFLGMNDLFKF